MNLLETSLMLFHSNIFSNHIMNQKWPGKFASIVLELLFVKASIPSLKKVCSSMKRTLSDVSFRKCGLTPDDPFIMGSITKVIFFWKKLWKKSDSQHFHATQMQRKAVFLPLLEQKSSQKCPQYWSFRYYSITVVPS